MGRFIIPRQQAPPRPRRLRSPTSPSHLAFSIRTQTALLRPSRRRLINISSSAPLLLGMAHQSCGWTMSHVWQCQSYETEPGWYSLKWHQIKLFTFKCFLSTGAKLQTLKERGIAPENGAIAALGCEICCTAVSWWRCFQSSLQAPHLKLNCTAVNKLRMSTDKAIGGGLQ